MEPIDFTKFEEKRDGAFIKTPKQENRTELQGDKNTKPNRKIDTADIKGLFEWAFNNLKSK